MPPQLKDPPLPKGWTKHVRSAFLHAVSLASTALTVAWSRAANSPRPTKRLQAELDRANTEIALLREELELKDARWSRLASRRRPHFSSTQRMRILQLRAARAWSRTDTANRFLIDEQTLLGWMRRLDEQGERALIQLEAPANRLPDFVRQLVKQLKTLVPTMGKVRIAQVLARAGLILGPTTVRRILSERDPTPDDSPPAAGDTLEPSRVVGAKRPGDIWHVDLTTVPTAGGFWVPWAPQALPQRWPFCWWLAVVLDHFSRAVIGFALFKKQPTATEIRDFVRRAARNSGAAPKNLITDRGKQFTSKTFRRWCRKRDVRQRFGAVGQKGSIAVIERFFRTLKSEGTRPISIPLRIATIREEMALFATWYNQHRPHRALDGRTPAECAAGTVAKSEPSQPEPNQRLTLVVGYLEDRRHLPVVQLRRAA